MIVPIVAYKIAWDPNNHRGYIFLTLQSRETKNITVTADDFVAIATVLNESPVFLNTDTGIIGTDWEQVGGT